MKIRLRSKRLAQLFAEVWRDIPEADRALLADRARLVVDDPIFLPKANSHQILVWSAVISIGVRKSITILCLSPRNLPHQPDNFVRYVIAHELAHIVCGHLELFSSYPNGITPTNRQTLFESEADARANLWGSPVAYFTRPLKPSRSSRIRVNYRKTRSR